MLGPEHDQNQASVLLLPGVAWQKPVSFMIDSGAERSVIPLSHVPSSMIFPSSTVLSSVDSKPIRTYGHCSTIVGVKTLRRAYKIDFIVTDTQPILGADFLTKYGLQLGMK